MNRQNRFKGIFEREKEDRITKDVCMTFPQDIFGMEILGAHTCTKTFTAPDTPFDTSFKC